MYRKWASILVIALAAAPIAWWVLLRSGRTGWTKFAVAWVACYCGVILFGIGTAALHSWIRPLMRRKQPSAAPQGSAEILVRERFEEAVMTAIIAAGLFSLLSVLIR